MRGFRVSANMENTNVPHVTASVGPSAARLVTGGVIELENKGGDDGGYWIAGPLPVNGGSPRHDAIASGTP